MIAIPAIDIRDGACVQLVGGSYDAERVRLPQPATVAQRWRDLGFRRLHVVDLDAATGRGRNDGTVMQLLRDADDGVQVGGGIRTAERACSLIDSGAHSVIVGTRALEDPDWLGDLAQAIPGRLVVAVDVRESRPVVRGWSRPIPRALGPLLADLSALPLAAIFVTAVDVEGRLAGPDLALMRVVLDNTSLPVIAAGGIATLDHLRSLDAMGVSAAVIGMALYTGDMDAARCAGEFG